jgi:hypothetical protein
MRSRLILFTFALYLAFALGCSKQPAADNTSDPNATDQNAPASAENGSAREPRERKEHKAEARRVVVVPAGTAVTINLGDAIGSKISQSGQTFAGSVAKDVVVGGEVAIRQGANVSGTVTDAKPLGKFAGGAVLQVRLDSINNVQVAAAERTFNQKGKGKRTAVATGGGAALGGIIGGLVGGGKGAAIGLAAGAGAGAGGSALTGNKEIVLPAESDITFELSQALELRK